MQEPVKYATEQDILDSIETGEIMLIAYHGGSKKGASRELLPLQVTSPDKYRARCYTSGSVKTFMMSKTEIIERNKGAAANWREIKKPKDIPPTTKPEGIATEHHDAWRETGWHISFYQIDWCEGGFGCGLHRPKKRGNGYLKNPSHSLEYRTFNKELVITENGDTIEELSPSKKPWRTNSRAYTTYGTALQKFIENVNADTPQNNSS